MRSFLGGDGETAGRLFAELAGLRPASTEPRILSLDDGELVPHRERYQRFMGFGEAPLEGVRLPGETVLREFRATHAAAMRLIARTMPELAGELTALVAQLVPVGQSPGSVLSFDGGSCYLLWGVVFLNIERRRSTVSLVEVLIHEASHLLLYAFAREEPLVRNGDDERYTSPLRSDPRPMDGIVHATWVSARMHWAMRTLAEAAVEPGMREEATAAAETDRLHFLEGLAVVRSHGRLTATGSSLIEAAAAYMGA